MSFQRFVTAVSLQFNARVHKAKTLDNPELMTHVQVKIIIFGLFMLVGTSLSGCTATSEQQAQPAAATPSPHPTDKPFPKKPTEQSFSFSIQPRDVKRTIVIGSVRVSYDAKTSESATATLITVTRSGKEIFSKALGASQVVAIGFLPATPISSALIYISTFSGGAHCCYGVDVVSVDANQAGFHDSAYQDLEDIGPSWKQLKPSGPYVLVSGDCGIAYKFGSYADTRFPALLYQFVGGHFVNVTEDYPGYVAEDAAGHYRDWLKYHVKTAIVAQVADLLTLHRTPEAANAFVSLQDEPMEPQMRQWLIAQGYGDPIIPASQAAGDARATSNATLPPLPPGAVPLQDPVSRPVHDGASADNNDCSQESIETVSDDGAFVKLLSGQSYIIDDIDRVDSQLWLATDDIVVCDPGRGHDVKFIHDNEIAHGHHTSE